MTGSNKAFWLDSTLVSGKNESILNFKGEGGW